MPRHTVARITLGSACLSLVLLLDGRAQAHEGHQHSSPSTPSAPPKFTFTAPTASAPPPPRIPTIEQPPVGAPPRLAAPIEQVPVPVPPRGQIKVTARHLFEVRYAPWGIQVFVSDPAGNPLSPLGILGDVVLEVRGDPRQWRFPLQYIAAEASPVGREHLLVLTDLSRVRDGDMLVLIDMARLPQPDETSVRFVQTFVVTQANPAVSAVPLTVTVGELSESDRAAVARQRTCPVTNDDFKHGPPIKLFVGDQVLYVCCEPCIDEVRQAPEKFLRLVGKAPPAALDTLAAQQTPPPDLLVTAPPANGVAVTPATIDDREQMERQQLCSVTNQPLGSRGVPLRVTAHGRFTYVCCSACIPAAERLMSPITTRSATSCSGPACSSCRGK